MNICNRRYIFYSVHFYKIRAVTNYLIVEIKIALQPNDSVHDRSQYLQQQKLKQHYSLIELGELGELGSISTIVEIKIALQPHKSQIIKYLSSTIVEIKIALQPVPPSPMFCPSTIVEIKIALQPLPCGGTGNPWHLQQQKLKQHYSLSFGNEFFAAADLQQQKLKQHYSQVLSVRLYGQIYNSRN